MATLCHSHQNIYAIAAINIFFFLLVDYSVIATGNAENEIVGLSAHLIRRNSQYGDFYKHKDKEFSRRLIGSDKPSAPFSTILTTSKMMLGHIMKLSIGTPPTDIYLLADTGSDLLWTDCQPCLNCSETLYPQFNREKSSTYRNMSCSAQDCRFFDEYIKPFDYANDCKKGPEQPCLYHYEYVDEAYTEGFLAKETITMTSMKGKPITLPNITVGCGIKNNNPSPNPTNNRTDTGLIGLGGGNLSFVSQIAPYVGGRRFSHCLVPHSADPTPSAVSKIYFGSGSELVGEEVVSTPLVVQDEQGGYIVKVAGMTIGDEFVSFKHTNGTILDVVVDSGTLMSRLPQPFFDQVRDLLLKHIDPKYEPAIIQEGSYEGMLCLNTSTFPQEETISTLHFQGGELPLTVDQLFYIEDNGKLCFSIIHDEKRNLDYGVLGAISQSNLWIGYDLDKKVMSFKHADCLK